MGVRAVLNPAHRARARPPLRGGRTRDVETNARLACRDMAAAPRRALGEARRECARRAPDRRNLPPRAVGTIL